MKDQTSDTGKDACRDMLKQFAISVIIPIYNTAKYLEDAIRSMIYQTLDFEQYIQLILVNDGSNDRSGEICQKYQTRYPENVIYIHFSENRGINSARNAGLKCASGKYINFLNSDDVWSLNTFQKAVKFLEENDKEIDLVSADIELFEDAQGMDILNQNLSEDSIIDIMKEYSHIRSNGSTCIIKKDVAQKYGFNEIYTRWEDIVFIYQIIQSKQKYGMLSSEVRYYYRKRQGNDLASQSYRRNKKYYLCGLNRLAGIYQESVNQYGYFLPMAQYLTAYALSHFFQHPISALTDEEKKGYDAIILNMVQHIEDKYLLNVCGVDHSVCKAMTAYKYGVDIRDELEQTKMCEKQLLITNQYLNKTNMNYRVLQQWFILRTQKKKLSDYFELNSYKNIAVYGMAELGQFLVLELKDSKINVQYAIDRRAGTLLSEIPILTIDNELPQVDVVVVTAVYYFSQITDSLQDKLECPVISIEDVMYFIP